MKKRQAEPKVSASEFGKRILALRQETIQTMTDLAEKLDVSEAYISLLESGKRHPSRKIVEKLVKVFSSGNTPLLRDQLLVLAGYDPHSESKAPPDQHLEKILQHSSSNSFPTYMALVNSLIRQGQYGLAQTRIEEGFKFFQKTVQLQMLVAYLELTRHNHDAAIVAMETALQFKALHPESETSKAELLLNLGVLHFFKGSAALAGYHDALSRSDAKAAKTFHRQARQDFLKAREVFDQGLTLEPENTNLRDEAARLAFNLADLSGAKEAQRYWQESIQAFETVLYAPDKDQLDEQALLESTCFLAHAFSKSGQFQQARKALDLITACQPRYAFGYYVLACHCSLWAASEETDTHLAQALLFLGKALTLKPEMRTQAWLEPDLSYLRNHRPQEMKTLLNL
ncbi:MAG: helix-turn-helix domain-containing protein [Candidatus Sericytochromatia bacterium]